MTVRTLLANALVALAIVLLLEGACRLSEGSPKYRESETLGYDLLPGYASRREHVNSAGLRGGEIAPRTPGTLRVLAMGGSTTWGHKVADGETWPALLQERLRATGLARAEVLNGGVSGWDLEQIVIALRDRWLDGLAPDLVLVSSGWNWPVLAGSPEVVRFRRMAGSSRHRDGLLGSALVRWLDQAIEPLRAWRSASDGARDDAGAAGTAGTAAIAGLEPAEAGAADAVFKGRRGIGAAMAAAYPRLYVELAALCRERGVAVAVVRYPALVQMPRPAGGPLAPMYDELLRTDQTLHVPLDDLDRAARQEYAAAMAVLDAAAPAAGLAVLDVAGRLETAAGAAGGERWMSFFRDRMHLTPAGNGAVADALAAELAGQGLLPAPR